MLSLPEKRQIPKRNLGQEGKALSRIANSANCGDTIRGAAAQGKDGLEKLVSMMPRTTLLRE